MAYFFNGRLWQTPGAMSAVDDSGMANMNLTVGNVLAIVGTSTGGKPKTALKFQTPEGARAALRSGDLADACVKAFSASNQTNAPGMVVALRVNPAVQASLTLQDASAAAAIDLVSTDYGLWTNEIKIKIETGTNQGKKVTTQYGTAYYSQDDIYRAPLSVQYTGAQTTATITVTNTTVTLTAGGSTIDTIDLTTYDTVQKLVDKINSNTGWTATVLNGGGDYASLNGLDGVTSQDVLTGAYTVTAVLQAVIDWINGNAEGYVTATRPAAADAPPANIPFTYLAGGSDGTTANTDWSDTFTQLQKEDVQWVNITSQDPSIAAMLTAHVQFMSTSGKMERRGFCGGALGQAVSDATSAAALMNDYRTSYVWPGYYDYDQNGNRVLLPPSRASVLIAAGFAGMNPGDSMTNKTVTALGLETDPRNPTDTDTLIQGGVCTLYRDKKGTIKVAKAISTWLNNTKYDKVSVSVGAALDFTVRNVRDAVEAYIGKKGNMTDLANILEVADTVLDELAMPEPEGPGVIVGDKATPAHTKPTGTLNGDVVAVSFLCRPVNTIDFIPVTVYATIFTATATAA